MNTRTNFYLFAAAAVLAIAASIAIRSHIRMSSLERAVGQAITVAEAERLRADRLETETHIYKEKAAYLETRISEIRDRASKQDEELKKLSADTDAARRALQRARGGSNKN